MRIRLLVMMLVVALGSIHAEDSTNNRDLQDPSRIFIGAGIGFLGAEVSAGYQYYFPNYIDNKWRQGVRGFGVVGYGLDMNSNTSVITDNGSKQTHKETNIANSFPMLACVEYTLEFTPKAKKVWGVFTGVGAGVAPSVIKNLSSINGTSEPSTTTSAFGFAWDARIGVSLSIDSNKHRFELSGGWIQYIGLHYVFYL